MPTIANDHLDSAAGDVAAELVERRKQKEVLADAPRSLATGFARSLGALAVDRLLVDGARPGTIIGKSGKRVVVHGTVKSQPAGASDGNSGVPEGKLNDGTSDG